MISVGVIGYGYWGPNIVRNFNNAAEAQVVAICDRKEDMLKRGRKAYPLATFTNDPEDILSSPKVDVVAVITPVFTHFELAKKALMNGKSVFVEKPFTSNSQQGEELIELADRKGLKIMVDHTFLFTETVRKMKELIDDRVLGDVYYFDSTRINLGLFQHDVNVIWDLAPHDLSIMDFLIDEKPTGVTATGAAHFGNDLEDIAYVTIYFQNRTIAHFNMNWLSPVKVRSVLIGGSKKMMLWNDLHVAEKLKVYDKGVDINGVEGIYDLLVSYRTGDVWIPKMAETEALKNEVEYFVDCLTKNRTPFNDGAAGLRVVRMLEAADKSLQGKGAFVEL
jgi:predicted dehydrogenase